LVRAPIERVPDHDGGRRRKLDHHLVTESERVVELAEEVGVGEPVPVGNVSEAQRSGTWFHLSVGDQRMLVEVPVVGRLQLGGERDVGLGNDDVTEVARAMSLNDTLSQGINSRSNSQTLVNSGGGSSVRQAAANSTARASVSFNSSTPGA